MVSRAYGAAECGVGKINGRLLAQYCMLGKNFDGFSLVIESSNKVTFVT